MAQPSEFRKNSYQKSLSEHGESPQALQWQNYAAAARRYRELVSVIDLDNRSILDAGCGMGDLLPYIYANANKFTYLGVDITPEFIEIAKKRYLGHEFKVADPFAGDVTEKFDVVFSSGTMNSNTPNWLAERQKMIKALYEITNEVLVFNMAGGLKSDYVNDRIAYANAQEVIDFCSTLSSKIILKTNYHPKDFMLALFK